MRILSFTAENFKKIRVVEIVPKGRMTTLTGRNGQGKTSVLDALWALLAGKRAIPEKPVRKGAEKSKLQAVLGDEEGRPYLVAKRTISGDRTTSLIVEAVAGAQRPAGTPQAVLDALIGEMSFDPVAFVHLDAKKQAEILRSIVKLDVNLDDIAQQNSADYTERTAINRKVAELRAQAAAVIFSPGLPKEKVDEAEIVTRRQEANQANMQMAERLAEKNRLGQALKDAESAENQQREQIEEQKELINRLEMQLTTAKKGLADFSVVLEKLGETVSTARLAWEQAPAAEMVDLSPLDAELEQAQLTNREIAKRERRDELERQVQDAERETARLTRSMEVREEKKREALASAKMPVDGLTFNEEGVWFKGIPLEQLGEAEQIRVGCALAMAANPKLRCIPIGHGESLDNESLALIEQLAEEHDFQIFMAKVDTSGKVGIVLEDGMVQAVNG